MSPVRTVPCSGILFLHSSLLSGCPGEETDVAPPERLSWHQVASSVRRAGDGSATSLERWRSTPGASVIRRQSDRGARPATVLEAGAEAGDGADWAPLRTPRMASRVCPASCSALT